MVDAMLEAYALKMIQERTVHDEESDEGDSDEIVSEISSTKEGLTHHD